MRSSDVLNLVLRLERDHPVANWSVDGVAIWPLLRVRLYTEILNRLLLPEANVSQRHRQLRQIRNVVRSCVGVTRARWRDRKSNATPRPGTDAVFLGDGVSFVRVGGQWYDRIFDPMIAWLQREGRGHFMMTPGDTAHWPRRSSSSFIQPALDVRKLLAASLPLRARTIQLEGFEAAIASLTNGNGPLLRFRREDAMRLWERLLVLAAYFEDVLRRAGPQRAFVNTYYSIEGMAFVLACRRSRVKVADVQHGVQGDHHVAYGQWTQSPREGYALLPDEFWVWSEWERRAIESWRGRSMSGHVPVVIGNAWLETWRAGSEAFVQTELKRASALPAGAKRVLVTLQWGLPDEETDKIVRAIRLADPRWHWWIRLHPYAANDRDAIRQRLSSAGATNAVIDEPTDLPLHALLAMADVHITHSSSTVLEAAEFRVPSILTSEYGAELFPDEVAAGRSVIALSDRHIAAAVDAATVRSKTEPLGAGTGNVLDTVMRRAFAAIKSPSSGDRLVRTQAG